MELLAEFGQSDTKTTWAGSIFNSMFSLAGPIGSVLTNAFNCRICIIIGSVLGLVGFGLSSLADEIYILYITYGLIAGIGQSLIFSGTIVSLAYYFPKRQVVATGFGLCGCAIAMLTLPSLIHLTAMHYGIRGTLRLIGAMMFQCAVFGTLMRPNSCELNRKVQLERDKKRDEINKSRNHTIHVQALRMLAAIKDLSTPQFALFCLSTFMWNVSLNISNLYFPVYFRSRGVSASEASYLISATGIGNLFTRFLVGFAASDERIGSHVLFFGTFSMVGVLTLLLPFYNSYTLFFMHMTSFGLYTGGVWVLSSTIIVELVNVLRLASAFGVVMLSAGVGQLIVPYIGDLFVTISTNGRKELNLSHIFMLSGILFITSGVLCAVTVIQSKSKDKQILEKEHIQANKDIIIENMSEMEHFIQK